MPDKSVSLSVRLSPDDAAFLSSYGAAGSASLSEKVRMIIAEARKRHTGNRGYAECLAFANDILAPTIQRIRQEETARNMHSELLLTFGNWAPDAVAQFIADRAYDRKQGEKELRALEAAVADRIFSLFELVLRLGVTGESPCYDRAAIGSRHAEVAKIIRIIEDAHTRKKD